MKRTLCILLVILINLSTSAQSRKIDSLVKLISNNQLFGECNYVWVLEMESAAGLQLLKIGKPATNKLVSVLTDTSKGIIAHYILSNIWKRTHMTSVTTYGMARYNYNGLFFSERKERFIVDYNDLVRNKDNCFVC